MMTQLEQDLIAMRAMIYDPDCWCQYDLMDDTGACCINGAALIVGGGEINPDRMTYTYRYLDMVQALYDAIPNKIKNDLENEINFQAAMDKLELEISTDKRFKSAIALTIFNDTTLHKEIIALCDHAIRIVRTKRTSTDVINKMVEFMRTPVKEVA